MTVINLHVGADAAHLVTDLGVVDYGNGTLLGFNNKVIWLPKLNAAFAVSGSLQAGEFLRGYLFSMAPDDADQLEYGMQPWLESAIDLARQQKAALFGEFAVLIAGCNDGRPFGTTCVVSDKSEGPDIRIFSGDFALPPHPSFNEVSAFTPDFERAALGLIEHQRASPAQMPTGATRVASGAAILTTVTLGAINSKVLQEWPDRIGESIVTV